MGGSLNGAYSNPPGVQKAAPLLDLQGNFWRVIIQYRVCIELTPLVVRARQATAPLCRSFNRWIPST